MGCLKQQTRDKAMNGGRVTFAVLTAHYLARDLPIGCYYFSLVGH